MSGVKGVIIAAPSSGSGKTLLTLGLARHWARSGIAVGAAKIGPDYIDSGYLSAASGRPCVNLDLWAMRPSTFAGAVADAGGDAGLVVCEGVMGLFDGASGGKGSTADVAALTGWPVILVLDARAQGASVAAIVQGFDRHRPDVPLAGVVFNRVAGETHAAVLIEATAAAAPHVACLGWIPRRPDLALPERHLGLVQAVERPDLGGFLDRAADVVAEQIDHKRLLGLARPWPQARSDNATRPLAPLGQTIAVAKDAAFSFRYPLVVEGWRAAGATLKTFSPLADEAPPADCDAVYLCGGYPELHVGRLAANAMFRTGLRAAAGRGAFVFGECGGYMALGEGLVDAQGHRHAMAALLPVETSFATPKLRLGYRRAVAATDSTLGPKGTAFRGHEFHYAQVVHEGPGEALFHCTDSKGRDLGAAGRVRGAVAGSFIHLIDRDDHGG